MRVEKWSEVPDEYYRPDLEELRDQAFRRTVAGVAGTALLAMFVMAAGGPVPDTSWVAPSLILTAVSLVAGIAYWAGTRYTVLGSLVLTVGLLTCVTTALVAYPGEIVAPWYSIVVIATTLLLGSRAGLLASLGSLGVVIVTALRPGGFTDERSAFSVAFLIVASVVLAYLATRPVHTALDWAWHGYVRAREKTDELRARQGELNSALKGLTDAYARLEAVSLELARARQAAEDARRLKAEFAANVSHELRTPLNLIVGFSEMMVRAPHTYGGEPLPQAYRADVEAIYRNAKHLSGLIDDVLDLSQVDAGRMELRKESGSLASVVREAAANAASLFESKGLSLTLDLPDSLPDIPFDRTRIRQVLLNLMNNAAKFTLRGGVAVTVREEGGDVTVAVADTGIGIAREDLSKVFEEFRQLDGSTRREQAGSGLGLAISKRFVELHGGNMLAESEPGIGSTFSFTLPTHRNVAGSTLRRDWETWARLSVPAPSADLPTVLVLDAEPEDAAYLHRQLGGCGVVAAASDSDRPAGAPGVRAVIAFASRGEEAGSLLDGTKALDQHGELPDNAPVFLCSRRPRESAAPLSAVTDYLMKPVTQERIEAALDRLGRRVRTILIVDDDPDMVRLLARMVHATSRRYRILRAQDGAEALYLLRTRRPDALMLDLGLPDADGLALLSDVREMTGLAALPVIVVTARKDPALVGSIAAVSMVRRGGCSLADLARLVRAELGLAERPDFVAATAP